MKVVAISRKPASGSRSVTQLIPDSEQIDRYDFGPVLISMRVRCYGNRAHTVILPVRLIKY